MPLFVIPHDFSGKYFVKGISGINYLNMTFGDLFEEIDTGLFMRFIDNNLPDWNSQNVCSNPGFIYLGDWSFNEFKSLSTNLVRASAVMSFLVPGLVPVSYSILSNAGTVVEGLDVIIDTLNLLPQFDIDKDVQYPMYYPVGKTGPLIVSLQDTYCQNSEEHIKNLFPLQPGNSWTYNFGVGMKVRGIESVKNRNLLVVENLSEIEEFYGFSGDNLYHYGFKIPPSLGEEDRIFFDPPLLFGDGSVSVGKNYKTLDSKIISENKGLIGFVNQTFSCEGRETIVLSNGNPYGDCFVIRDSAFVENSSTGETASGEGVLYLAKNVGPVRRIIEDYIFDLKDSEINLNGDVFLGLEKESESLIYANFTSKMIIENVL